MQKYIRITMPDGSKYDVPAEIVVKNRAGYYANGDVEIYDEEYAYTMKNNDEIVDWAANNMNWVDVEKYAIRVVEAEVDFQEGWLNGDKEIVEK